MVITTYREFAGFLQTNKDVAPVKIRLFKSIVLHSFNLN